MVQAGRGERDDNDGDDDDGNDEAANSSRRCQAFTAFNTPKNWGRW